MTDTAHSILVAAGVDPHHWYDAKQFCEILRVGERRRDRLVAELRNNKDAISNGHSLIAEGIVMLKLMRDLP